MQKKIKLLIKFYFIIFIILIAFFNAFFVCNIKTVKASNNLYAKVISNNCILFKNENLKNDISNKICTVEKTYFVEILNEINSYIYKVKYANLTGYISAYHVKKINEKPKILYPKNIFFNISSFTDCYIRSTPETVDNNKLIKLSKNTKNVELIAKAEGSEAIDFGGNIWYLAKYNNTVGYVYSKYTENLNIILPNTENVTYLSASNNIINPLNNFNCLIIIISTLIPVILILFLIYKPIKLKPKSGVVEYVKNSDNNYFDENL